MAEEAQPALQMAAQESSSPGGGAPA
jgi:hypothetical protein